MKGLKIVMAGKTARMYLYGYIGDGESSSRSIAMELERLEAKGIKLFELHINSQGGNLFDGIAIYNLLRERNVDIVIDGVAASAASLIAMAGKTIRMHSTGFLMIHNPGMFAIGEEKDMEKATQLLKQFKEACLEAYSARTGLDKDDIKIMMDDETWFNADDALDKGFIDEIIESKEDKPTNNANAGDAIMRDYLIQMLGLKADATDEQIQAAMKAKADADAAKLAEAEAKLAKLENREPETDAELAGKVETLTNTVSALEAKLKAERAETVVNAAIAAGKILPSQKNDYLATAKIDPDAFAADMEKREKIFDPSKGLSLDPQKPNPQPQSAQDYLRQKWTAEGIIKN